MRSALLRRPRAAFTLVEILMVVTIIMILAGIVVPKIVHRGTKAREQATRIQMDNLRTALNTFAMDLGRYPNESEGLVALLEKPADVPDSEWPGRYLDLPEVPTDSYGTPFQYEIPTDSGYEFELTSAGPDRRFGTEDDLRLSDTWKKKAEQG